MKIPTLAKVVRWIAPLIVAWVGSAFPAHTAVLDVSVQHRWGDRPLLVGDPFGGSKPGESISVDRLDYLLSDFVLVGLKDDSTRITNQFAFISAGRGRTEFSLTDLPPGEYRELSFTIGLSPEVNHQDARSFGPQHPLNPGVNGLHWGWQGGFIFVALEGHWQAGDHPSDGYSFHLATDRARRTVRIPVNLRLGVNQRLKLGFFVDRMLTDTTHGMVTREATSTHSRTNDLLADRLADRIPAAWEPLEATLSAEESQAVLAAPARVEMAHDAAPYRFKMPRTFPQPNLPSDNPLTEPGVALGHRLFHESRLSGNHLQSCASCHHAPSAFTDENQRFSVGSEGGLGTRNAMSLLNLAWQTQFFWDGRAASLRRQVLEPIQNPLEMHALLADVVHRLAIADYGPAFEAAFGTPEISADRVARALEQYLLTLVSGDSKFDRAMAGRATLTEQESQGLALFFTEYDPRHEQFGADCFHCHNGPLFSDFSFHNNGLDSSDSGTDPGRSRISGRAADLFKFKTPSLRNVAVTAPYMHDGRFQTLEEAVGHYAGGVRRSPTLDPNLAKHPDGGVPLSVQDQNALVAFLKTLTDPALPPGRRRESDLAGNDGTSLSLAFPAFAQTSDGGKTNSPSIRSHDRFSSVNR